jgi:hypothetical protein
MCCCPLLGGTGGHREQDCDREGASSSALTLPGLDIAKRAQDTKAAELLLQSTHELGRRVSQACHVCRWVVVCLLGMAIHFADSSDQSRGIYPL